MKSPQYWVDQFNQNFIVPDSVPEEATHNCISEDFVRQIQEDACFEQLIALEGKINPKLQEMSDNCEKLMKWLRP
jgi:hypothetical protein